ncbi:NAC transcription factor NAM-B2 [Amborella trichopoda]|uniref:NAC domain-containing protein n=1 Tax=Amborella trichopoda TaxID=13333 RepID=W1PM05_AMBTC|nr:NAC transcription factor NAM-B2 [Amborella trichopoda]ERN08799.1 hypothetical protein AMTR_s00017p00255350 [Amborella trichopoda]|eukprot:XP_020524559.1 NAC transcription factor NAM-B2 [Amborella trichopoda]
MGDENNLPPGFRFNPTDEELVLHYLIPKARHSTNTSNIITEIDIYKFDPWQLPSEAMVGEQHWYFFCPRKRRQVKGSRSNRPAISGYWMATGTDTPVLSGSKRVGLRKDWEFYSGKAPRGSITYWTMHEYLIIDADDCTNSEDWVLCHVYDKSCCSSSGDEGRELSCMDEIYASLDDFDDITYPLQGP